MVGYGRLQNVFNDRICCGVGVIHSEGSLAVLYISLIIKETSRYTGAYIERNLQIFETITSLYPIYTYLSTCWFFK